MVFEFGRSKIRRLDDAEINEAKVELLLRENIRVRRNVMREPNSRDKKTRLKGIDILMRSYVQRLNKDESYIEKLEKELDLD